MIGSGLARRYVQALFNIAQEKDILEKVQEDLKALSELLNNLPEVFSFLFDPSIGRTAKKGALKEIFKDASEFTLNFYFLIIDKNRIEILVDVYRIFDELCNSLKGIITGTIHSAVALDNKLSYEIKGHLENRFSCKLQMTQEIDPDLLGGLRIQVGNTVIDSSVLGRLNRLEELLISN